MSDSKAIETLYDCAVKAASFQEILDRFFELTGLTALAADQFDHIIAAAGNIQSKHGGLWDEMISSGANCTVRDIRHENTLLMKLAVTCSVEPNGDNDILVSALSNSLHAAWFRLRYTALNMPGSKSRYLLSLLSGDTTAASAAGFSGPFVVAVSVQSEQAANLLDAISSISGKQLLFACDNNEYIFLINADDAHTAILNDLARQHHLTLGISQTFTDLGQTSCFRLQASSAAAAAARFPGFSGCANFDDMKLFLMFDMISCSDIGISITDPQVELLAKSDKEKNTGFMRTLFCWLLNSQHAAAAAKQLGIHRNTLDNRLSKINELIDADWNSCTYCTCMLYSLYITLDKLGQLEFFDSKQ